MKSERRKDEEDGIELILERQEGFFSWIERM